MENKQEQREEKTLGFGQDRYFLEDSDCLSVITVRADGPEKSCFMFVLTIWRSCLPTSCVHAADRLRFPQETWWEPQEDKTSMKCLEENDNTN